MRGAGMVRTAAAAAMLAATLWAAGCAPADNAEQLFNDLTSSDIEARQEAADKIEAIVRRNDYQVLLRGLSNPNLFARAQTIIHLSRMTSPEARAALVDLLAVDKRMMLPYNPVRLRYQSEPSDSRVLVATLIRRTGPDPTAITRLLEGAEQNQTSEMLIGTCYAVGALGDPAGAGFLERAARHPETQVVRAAVQALGKFDGPETLAALRSASTHTASEVRTDALSALATREEPEARSIIMEMGRQDPEPEVRASALEILGGRAGDDLVPYFIDRLADAPESVRPTVVDILVRLTGKSLGPKRETWARYWSSRERTGATR